VALSEGLLERRRERLASDLAALETRLADLQAVGVHDPRRRRLQVLATVALARSRAIEALSA